MNYYKQQIKIKLVQAEMEPFKIFRVNQHQLGFGSMKHPIKDKAFLNYILNWDWNLTACDLFTIDYKLFPMVRIVRVFTSILCPF